MIVLHKIYQLWCLMVVVFSILIVAPLYLLIFFLFKTKQVQTAHSLSKVWAKFLLTMFFIPVKVIGKEKIDPAKTYVFVSNHQSQLDIPLVALSTGNTFQFLAKEELVKIPVLGYIIKNLYITVDRGTMRARVLGYQKMKQAIANNISVWIYPEGTRNQDTTTLLPLQEGAFRLAKDTQTPLAVLTIKGSNHILPQGKNNGMRWGKVEMIWSEPIQSDDIDFLIEYTKEQIIRNLNTNSYK